METKEIIKVLRVLRFDLASTYDLPTPTDFSILSDLDKCGVYSKLFDYVCKNLSSMSNIIQLCELVNGD